MQLYGKEKACFRTADAMKPAPILTADAFASTNLNVRAAAA